MAESLQLCSMLGILLQNNKIKAQTKKNIVLSIKDALPSLIPPAIEVNAFY